MELNTPGDPQLEADLLATCVTWGDWRHHLDTLEPDDLIAHRTLHAAIQAARAAGTLAPRYQVDGGTDGDYRGLDDWARIALRGLIADHVPVSPARAVARLRALRRLRDLQATCHRLATGIGAGELDTGELDRLHQVLAHVRADQVDAAGIGAAA